MSFTTFPTTDRDHGSPINEDLVAALYDRDEDLRERPLYFELAEIEETGTSYAQKSTWQLYVPQWCATLSVAVQYKTQQITSGEVQCRIGALTSSTLSDTKAQYADSPAVDWCVFSDLSTVLSTEVTMTIWSKVTTPTGGTPWIRIREADGPASYFAV